MKLLELIAKNSKLRFFDLRTIREYSISDLVMELPIETKKRFLVFIYTDNSIASIATLFSFWNCEEATIALFGQSVPESLKKSLEQLYRPLYIVDDSRFDITEFSSIESKFPFKLFQADQQPIYLINNEIKLLLSTSGTTGSPKLVKLSERNVVENALSIIDYLPIQSTDKTPLNLPVHYSYGLSVLTTNAIAGGTIFTSVDDVLKRSFWEQFRSRGFTSIAGVPFVYEMLNRLGFLSEHLQSLRYFTQAGGRLATDLIEKFYQYSLKNNCTFYVMYGQTEATARMSFLPPLQMPQKMSSIGLPIKNGSFAIDQESNELLYSGPNVFGGYSECIIDLSVYEQPKWLNTGDIARMDNDGYFYIIGRLKRFAKIAGSRINLDELESHLKQHLDIHQLACTNLDDKKLLLFLNDEIEINEEKLMEFLRNKFNIHHSLVQLGFLPDFPLSVNGKVNYELLRNKYALQ